MSTGPKPLYKEIQRVVRNNFQLQSLEHLSLTITFKKYRICLVIFRAFGNKMQKQLMKNSKFKIGGDQPPPTACCATTNKPVQRLSMLRVERALVGGEKRCRTNPQKRRKKRREQGPILIKPVKIHLLLVRRKSAN